MNWEVTTAASTSTSHMNATGDSDEEPQATKAKRMKRGKIRNYTEEQMRAAVAACVQGGMSVIQASGAYSIPLSTLKRSVKRNKTTISPFGPSPGLPEQTENKLAWFLSDLVNKGFPVRLNDILRLAKELSDVDKIQSNFKNGDGKTPSRGWAYRYLSRHKYLTITEKHKFCITEESVQEWYKQFWCYAEKNNITDILQHPELIFNIQEIALPLSPTNAKFIERKEINCVLDELYETDNISAVITTNAAGEIAPIMTVFQQSDEELDNTIPQDVIKGISENGWMTGNLFFQYLKQWHHWLVKKQYLNADNNIKKIILFVNGCNSSHIDFESSLFCDQVGIIIYCLHPFIRTPTCVGIITSLHNEWSNLIHDYNNFNKNEYDASLTKYIFAPFLQTVIQRLAKEIIINAYHMTSLYPFNYNNLDYTTLISDKVRKLKHPSCLIINDGEPPDHVAKYSNPWYRKIMTNMRPNSKDHNEAAFKLFESFIPHHQLEALINIEQTNQLITEDHPLKLLYQVWKNYKTEVYINQNVKIEEDDMNSDPEYSDASN